MLQRNDMVSDFAQIFWTVIDNSPGFGSQQFAQCGLSALDDSLPESCTKNMGNATVFATCLLS